MVEHSPKLLASEEKASTTLSQADEVGVRGVLQIPPGPTYFRFWRAKYNCADVVT